ncbi:hypothetical protein F5883DRAFT_550724 [Diaporthe sp. PMI_573]|nr:hypothetical protein F5883DRAFT_550724 [Diaporthaceae sp. PMI_573]
MSPTTPSIVLLPLPPCALLAQCIFPQQHPRLSTGDCCCSPRSPRSSASPSGAFSPSPHTNLSLRKTRARTTSNPTHLSGPTANACINRAPSKQNRFPTACPSTLSITVLFLHSHQHANL